MPSTRGSNERGWTRCRTHRSLILGMCTGSILSSRRVLLDQHIKPPSLRFVDASR